MNKIRSIAKRYPNTSFLIKFLGICISGVCITIFAGCGISVQEETSEGVEIVVIDRCQYIKNQTASLYYVYTHKGNCNNPMHIYKIEKQGE